MTPLKNKGVTPGIISFLCILLVFVLASLAAIALLSAQQTHLIVEKSLENQQAYYSADLKALKIYEKVERAYAEGPLPETIDNVSLTLDENNTLSYRIPVRQDTTLKVSLLLETPPTLSPINWSLQYTGSWEPDETLNVLIP